LTFVTHQGTQWQTAAIWRSLVAAAVQGTSIEAACNDWADGPDSNTVRAVLRECVDNGHLEVIETATNACLQSAVPGWLRRQAVEVALDLHEEPYYGRSADESAFIARGQARRGTTHFYRVATAYVLQRGVRLTLAVVFLRKGETPTQAAQTLVQRLKHAGLRLRRLYADKGFRSVELFRFLLAQHLPAIIAVPLNRGAHGMGAKARGRRSYRTTHTFHHPQWGALTVPVVLVRIWERRKGKRVYRWLAFVVLHLRAEPHTIRQWYRRRFGIESSYRLVEQLRIRTSSRCSAWHFFFIALALVLLTAWNRLQWHYTAHVRRGAVAVREGVLRLHRFTRFVLQAVESQFHLKTSICVQV
jgi:putative transposase